jgi:hypothetical protein
LLGWWFDVIARDYDSVATAMNDLGWCLIRILMHSVRIVYWLLFICRHVERVGVCALLVHNILFTIHS